MGGHQQGNLILGGHLPNEVLMVSFDLVVRMSIEVGACDLFGLSLISSGLGLSFLGGGLYKEFWSLPAERFNNLRLGL